MLEVHGMNSGFAKVIDFQRYSAATSHLFNGTPCAHRKHWELVVALAAFTEHARLKPGASALGYGVGCEIIPSVLAGLDVNVTATDQASPDAGWVTSGQYAGQKTKLYYPQYCTPQQFDTYVRYAHADMRHPPCDEHLAQFDFVWSLNSLDHLGSIEAANRFIFDSLKCLKPGGRAVHTTEFSVFPESPVREGGTIFYARECWTELLEALTAANYTVTMDWDLGSNPLDYWVDVPPYSMQHMKLHFEGRVCTSVLLVVDKPA